MPRRADPVEKYARDVLDGRIAAGRPVRLACQRHMDDLKREGLEWRREMAENAISFFEDLLVLENGKPFLLLPFQRFIVGSLFGWYMRDGSRRFRTAYIETAKGNGKTPLAAGVGLYGLVADDEPAAEIYSAAVTKDQARLVWRDADRFVKASPELSELIQQNVGLLSIPDDQSIFRPISAEHRGLDGKRVHMALIDELHEHPSSIVVDKIRAGTKARKNALIFEITNSGYDRHSVCWVHHDFSLKVLDGVYENDSWFAYVSALDEGDDWKSEKAWLKANPGLRRILPIKYLREQVAEAIAMPSKENIVRRLNFCQWTEQSVRWLSMAQWDKGAGKVDPEALRGRVCYAGLDLARVHDLSAFVLLFPPQDDEERFQCLTYFWIPDEDIITRSTRDRVPYDVWVNDGYIKATPGNVTDFDYIKSDILDLAGIYDIREVAFDRTFAGEIVQGLMQEGLNMIEFGQGFYSMPAPTAELERMIKGERLRHGGNPVLRWNASNVSVAQNPAGDIKPDKERSIERIDGIVALIMAIGRSMVQDAPGSVYETRGLLSG